MIVVLGGFFGCSGLTALDIMGIAGTRGLFDRLYGYCVIDDLTVLSVDLGRVALERYASLYKSGLLDLR